jgi:hypothetical protein
LTPVRGLVVSLLLWPSLCAPVFAADHPAFLTGYWFGQGEPHDKSEMWLGFASANGDFSVQFRACRKGKASDLFQKGKWSFQGGVETVQITQSGSQIVFNETPYKILAHDGKSQTYSLPSGFTFHSKRVDAKFTMPPCDLVS